MEVAIYIRVSTKLQEDKYSLEAQRLELTRYANEQKWNIVDIYKDVDSGGKLHKPGLESLMDAVDDNLIDVVLCVDQDRLSRLDTIEWEILKKTLRDNNVKIAEPGRIVDLDNEDDEFISDIKNLIAKREKKMIVRRMTRGLKQFTREGKLYGRQPDEYFLKDGKAYINDSHAWAISKIDDLYLNERMGFTRIANRLNEVSRTANGKRWSPVIVYSKLKNVAYHGVLQKKFGNELIEVEGVYPPLRTKETYEKIQKRLQGNHRSPLPGAAHFLRDINIRCTCCGNKIGIASGSNEKKNYYLKHTFKHAETCEYEKNSINAARFKKPLERAVTDIVFDEESAQSYLDMDWGNDNVDVLKKQLEQTRTSLAHSNDKMDGLIDLYLESNFSKSALDARKEKIEMEISFLEKEVDQLERKINHSNNSTLSYEVVFEYFRHVIEIDDEWPERDKQLLFGSLFPTAYLDFETEQLRLTAEIAGVEFEIKIDAVDDFEYRDEFLKEIAAKRYKETQDLINRNPGINFKKLCALSQYNAETLRKDAARFGWWQNLPLRKGSPELKEQRMKQIKQLLLEHHKITAKEISKRLNIYEGTAQKLVREAKNELKDALK